MSDSADSSRWFRSLDRYQCSKFLHCRNRCRFDSRIRRELSYSDRRSLWGRYCFAGRTGRGRRRDFPGQGWHSVVEREGGCLRWSGWRTQQGVLALADRWMKIVLLPLVVDHRHPSPNSPRRTSLLALRSSSELASGVAIVASP